jgi:hypothetical protein
MRNIFIKLHLHNTDEIIYININHIVSLYPLHNCTSIGITDSPYRVKESIEEIIEITNKAQERWI